nr:MAG TPA: hypothetical protein [Caudoviricetes sp.]
MGVLSTTPPSVRLLFIQAGHTAAKIKVTTGSAKNNVGCYLQS